MATIASLLSLFVVYCMFVGVSCQELVVVPKAEGETDVIALNRLNFDEATSKGEWMIEFYSPTCPHCTSLEPIWEELATSLKGSFSVGKVDCTVDTDVCKRFRVDGYPQVSLLKNGHYYNFNRPRTVYEFTRFAQKLHTVPSVVHDAILPPVPPTGPNQEL